ncbi:isoprenylcysteine carboxyl methyltransferase family protein [Aquibacillus sediminis]|uniref:isoprenylcysteine carboxyl methyltransferase family protein n=1 Tax=Aquibacillus sediminis TaxID=2574734 RepID=UPI0011089C82|nr:isoprenylcysteine carboxylmethyltransferase family protein [Aquibacillus sediminis]
MSGWLWYLFAFLVLQRLIELVIAKRNEQWMYQKGAYEVGKDHYKWFILVHSLFFLALLVEGDFQQSFSPVLFGLFLVTQLLRIWCLVSLGKFWNTKIIILPGARLVEKGPYRFMKHPNYVVVAIELFIIPIMFHAYVLAIIFPLLHLILLTKRIPVENKVLIQCSHKKS